MGQLLTKEVEKKTDDGKRIEECQKAHKLGKSTTFKLTVTVDDEVVIKVLKTEVDRLEKIHQSWIC